MNSNKLYMNVKDVKQIINIINQNIRYWSNNLIFITYPPRWRKRPRLCLSTKSAVTKSKGF